MSDTLPPPVQMPDDSPRIRRAGQPIPPPRVMLRNYFTVPPSLEGLKKERFAREAYRR